MWTLALESSSIACGNVKCYSCIWKTASSYLCGFFFSFTMYTLHDLTISPVGIYPKEMKSHFHTHTKKDFYMDVHKQLYHNSPKAENSNVH